MFTSRQQFTIEQTQVAAYAQHLNALMDFSAEEEWHIEFWSYKKILLMFSLQ